MNFLKYLRVIYARNRILKALKEGKDYIMLPKVIHEMSLKEKIRYIFFINPEPVKMTCRDYLFKVMQENRLNYHDVVRLCDARLLKLLQGEKHDEKSE